MGRRERKTERKNGGKETRNEGRKSEQRKEGERKEIKNLLIKEAEK